MRGAVAKACVASLPAFIPVVLYFLIGPGGRASGTEGLARGATTIAIVVLCVSFAFAWRLCYAPRLVVADTKIVLYGSFLRLDIATDYVTKFASSYGRVELRLRDGKRLQIDALSPTRNTQGDDEGSNEIAMWLNSKMMGNLVESAHSPANVDIARMARRPFVYPSDAFLLVGVFFLVSFYVS